MKILVTVLMVICFAGQALAQTVAPQECDPTDGKECEMVFMTLEEMQAAQTQDVAAMQQIIQKYQTAMDADKTMALLRKRINRRAGAIKREEQLQEEGLLKKAKKKKK